MIIVNWIKAWDILGNNGKKVIVLFCVFDPHLIYYDILEDGKR